ncbi:unnamed protein product [Mucor hiemalis]
MTIAKKPFVFMAAALAENGGIGYKNGLPWSIPGDWEYFENVTTKFMEDRKPESPLAELANSLTEAFEKADALVKENGRIFVLGGEEIYRQSILLPGCTHVLLTNVRSSIPIPCDTFIPKIDPAIYRLASHEELESFIMEQVPEGIQTYENFQYELVLYIKRYIEL